MKYRDLHRERFATGDWTDDSDQMILILLSLVANNGQVRGNFNLQTLNLTVISNHKIGCS